jgi:hypothetical protein
VITGSEDDLEQIVECVSSGGCLMLLLLGPLGLLLGTKSATLTYSLEADFRWRRDCWRLGALTILLLGFILLGLAYVLQMLGFGVAGVVMVMLGLAMRRMFGGGIKIANVWDGEIFIRGLPAALVDEVLVSYPPEISQEYGRPPSPKP